MTGRNFIRFVCCVIPTLSKSRRDGRILDRHLRSVHVQGRDSDKIPCRSNSRPCKVRRIRDIAHGDCMFHNDVLDLVL